MDQTIAIEAIRALTWNIFQILLPSLIVSLAIAVLIGILQAMMQIQEQTISFFPKLIALFAILYFTGPWMLDQLIEYMKIHFESIPSMVRR